MSLALHYIKNRKYKNEKSLPKKKQSLHFYIEKERREAPQCIWQRGALTVEAAVILPLLACFFSFLLFYFRIMQVQIAVQDSLEQTARKIAVFSVKELEASEDAVEYFAVAKSLVYLELRQNAVVEKYVSGGALGVSLLASEFDGDYILLRANYGMNFPVNLLGRKIFLISQKAQVRKWTGWHVVNAGMEAGMTVFVTQYGEVYHMRTSCPYLKLSIQSVAESVIFTCRNENGGKYKACERCVTGTSETGTAYITAYGERYHYEIGCSGLKRTVYQKKLSEVGGMEACPKCWK